MAMIIDDGPISVVGEDAGQWNDPTQPYVDNIGGIFVKVDASKPAKGIVQIELRKTQDNSLIAKAHKNLTNESGTIQVGEVRLDGAIVPDFEDNGSTTELIKYKCKGGSFPERYYNWVVFVAGNMQFLTVDSKQGDIGSFDLTRDNGFVTLSGKGNKEVQLTNCRTDSA